MKKLVVVESPTKVRKILKFLKNDFQVVATGGHFRDLPYDKIGISLESIKENGDAKPWWEIIPSKRRYIGNLRRSIENAEEIYLATDPDREGEAIGWHIKDYFGLDSAKRIVFHEVTEKAVKKAFEQPRELDEILVSAQKARRILDRIVGYTISPILWRIRKNSSAGRVQSAVLSIIVKRYKMIKDFVPQKFWNVFADFKDFWAFYVGNKLQSEPFRFLSKEEAEDLISKIQHSIFVINSLERKDREKAPPPPLTTSSLLQSASYYGFSSSKTMSIAQNLFEKGFITYHRTDSVNLSNEALSMARSYIKNNYPHLSLDFPRRYKTKVANAQEAHEAIRPTYQGLYKKGERISGEEQKILDIVTKRFIASQTKPAIYDTLEIFFEVANQNKKEFFRSYFSVLKFKGYLEILQEETEKEEMKNYGQKSENKPVKEEEQNFIPEFLERAQKGESISPHKLILKEGETKPPSYYTESSLIKEMERLGIGRPSTYSQIIKLLFSRKYIMKDGKKILPTEDGIFVDSILTKSFPEIIDVNYTSLMEENLDRISRGEMEWQKFMKEFYNWFNPKLEDFREKLKMLNPSLSEEKKEESRRKTKTKKKKKVHSEDNGKIENVNKICPKCNSKLALRINSRTKQRFLGCSTFPKCRYTESLPKNEK